MHNQPENIESEAVRSALQDLLDSPGFRASKQCQLLLRYIVDHTLAGEENLLRERVIGMTVFGRPPDYDTGNDPVVRARVGEVRKRLAQYYVDHRDASGVLISIPSGSYRASFSFSDSDREKEQQINLGAPPDQASESPTESTSGLLVEGPAARKRTTPDLPFITKHVLWACIVAFTLLLAVGGVAWFLRTDPQEQGSISLYRRFWAPLILSTRPVLLYIGANYAYRLSPKYLEGYREQQHLPYGGPEFFIDLKENGEIANKDLLPTNNLIGFGDVAATGRLIATLTQLGKKYDLRYGDDIAVTDLTSSTTILIGGFSNPWSTELTSSLRYSLENGDRIVDHRSKSTYWQVQESDGRHPHNDYVVISRLVRSQTGSFVLIIAGIDTPGNQAAADFLAEPEKIGKLLRAAPAGWQRMNMQIVLQTAVLNNVPRTSTVLATHYW